VQEPTILRVSHYASRSPSENSVCRSETAVPPKCANETRALRSRQMSRKFVSARKLSLLDSRKVPGLTEEFAKQRGQKLEIRQIFNSWRREWDSNHESASPYLFEISIEFSELGTRGMMSPENWMPAWLFNKDRLKFRNSCASASLTSDEYRNCDRLAATRNSCGTTISCWPRISRYLSWPIQSLFRTWGSPNRPRINISRSPRDDPLTSSL
jgi:hypothetical protein